MYSFPALQRLGLTRYSVLRICTNFNEIGDGNPSFANIRAANLKRQNRRFLRDKFFRLFTDCTFGRHLFEITPS